MSLYQEHLDRVLAAVALEPVDRVPVMQSGSACNAAFCGKTLQEYCDDPVVNTDCNLAAAKMWGEVDGTQLTCFQPRNMARMWFGRVLMPGHELPENELSNAAGVSISPTTRGPLVNESLQTSVPGVFACGNVLHVHDLVDYVSEEAAHAGASAAANSGRSAFVRE